MNTERHAGVVIKERLEAMGKTQTWLAVECNVSDYAVSKWISTGKIGRTNALKVAEALKIGLDVLLKGGAIDEAGDSLTGLDNPSKVFLSYCTEQELELLSMFREANGKGREMMLLIGKNAPKRDDLPKGLTETKTV